MKLILDNMQIKILNYLVMGKNRHEIAELLNIKHHVVIKHIAVASSVNDMNNNQLLYHFGYNSKNIDAAHIYDVKRFEVVDENLNERVFEATKATFSASVSKSVLRINIHKAGYNYPENN